MSYRPESIRAAAERSTRASFKLERKTLRALEAESQELYPALMTDTPAQNACAYAARHAHIVAKTVSVRQVYEAARAIGERIDGVDWITSRAAYLDDARAALRAAGFAIEEAGV